MKPVIPCGIASLDQVASMIIAGRALSLAGAAKTLARLPEGRWIGGTVAEFLINNGLAQAGDDAIYYSDITDIATDVRVRYFSLEELTQISDHYPEHGYALIVVPGDDSILPYVNEIFLGDDSLYNAPLVGWVSGTGLDGHDEEKARSYAGEPGGLSGEAAVMFVSLPDELFAHIQTVNPYSPRKGPDIQFPTLSQIQTDCLVDGELHNFADFLASAKIDYGLPLIADWDGAQLSAAIISADAKTGETRFMMPVCPKLTYRLTKNEPGMEDSFLQAANEIGAGNITGLTVCAASVLHAHHGKLPNMIAPVAFGQIAYAVSNQILTFISIEPLGIEEN